MANSDRLRALAESDPEQFRKLMQELAAKTLRPHAGQKKVLESEARFKVMNCGRRWGKTKLAAHMILKEARKGKKMTWWVAPTYKVVKRGYNEVLSQLPDGMLTHDPPPDSNFDAGRSVILRFKNGSRMEFYSAERPEGMLGAGVDFAVLDEAAIMPSRIWNQIVRPTLMDRLGGALMISTPRGRNWFYQVWLQGQDPQQPEWDSWTFTSASNPTLPPGEVEDMRHSMPRLEYEQEVEAKFLAAGSSVFIVEDSAIQYTPVLENGLVEGVKPKGFVVLGVDLARTYDYTVIYGARMSDRRNCYYERMQAVTWPEQKRRIRRAVRTLQRHGADAVLIMIDSTGVGDPVAEDLEAEGYDVVPINFTTHKTNMVRLLAKDIEEGEAFLLEEGQLDEFKNYSMAITPAGRVTYSAPEGEHDDVVSAKMLQHWGCINEGFGEVTMLSADSPAPTPAARPSEDTDDEDDWSDLVDDPDDLGAAAEAVGLPNPTRLPTPEELLVRGWF